MFWIFSVSDNVLGIYVAEEDTHTHTYIYNTHIFQLENHKLISKEKNNA